MHFSYQICIRTIHVNVRFFIPSRVRISLYTCWYFTDKNVVLLDMRRCEKGMGN